MDWEFQGDLKDLVSYWRTHMDFDLLKDYFTQIVRGLKHIHDQGLCHRDMKCDNVLRSFPCTALIVDFGCSKATLTDDQHVSFTQTGRMGTPTHMAPEVITAVRSVKEAGKKRQIIRTPYDPMRADMWSLGLVLFEMIEGHMPFEFDSEQEYFANIPNPEIEIPRLTKKDCPEFY